MSNTGGNFAFYNEFKITENDKPAGRSFIILQWLFVIDISRKYLANYTATKAQQLYEQSCKTQKTY